ncbi:hypothetical protein B6N13_09600 [Marinomonas sp. UCMA 3892]|jgi:hypothetical protein|nr:hypothetical protein [Marinomonas sp. UCMA 3892]
MKGIKMNKEANRITLFWLTTAVGAVLFVTLQLFFFLNDYVIAQGKGPNITFETNMLWMFSAYYGTWIVTVLLTLIGTTKSQWLALIIGTLLVALNTLGGIVDGMRDGAHVTFSALFFITLPGVCAMVATWRALKK